MTLKWNGVIQRKLALMDREVMQLEAHVRNASRERFVQDWGMRTISERAVQVCVEIMIDIAERIIALAGAGPVATAAEAIDRLVQLNVLRDAEPYRSMVRMRNLIVHAYEEVNPDMLYDVVSGRLDDFRRFRDEIDRANHG
jgi:uncharacterized protein YutE (UPF0331/DUF86 family)